MFKYTYGNKYCENEEINKRVEKLFIYRGDYLNGR